MTETEARQLAALQKSAQRRMVWEPRQNQANYQFCHALLLDGQGATIPGLTVELQVRAPVFVDACLYQFTLFQLRNGKRLRTYQLEVVPQGKRSHNGTDGALYGPHEHFGEHASPVDDTSVTCSDWPACLAYFLRQCPIGALNVNPPC